MKQPVSEANHDACHHNDPEEFAGLAARKVNAPLKNNLFCLNVGRNFRAWLASNGMRVLFYISSVHWLGSS